LHFDFDAIDIDCFDFEVDSDGGDVGHFILFIYIAKEDICFAYGGITDYY
jgi:hypothetical protein